MSDTVDTLTCTRCGRTRRVKTPRGYTLMIMRKNKRSGKMQPRCAKRSVCSSIARRRRAKRK